MSQERNDEVEKGERKKDVSIMRPKKITEENNMTNVQKEGEN